MKVEFDKTEFHLTETTVSALKIFMLLFLKNLRGGKQFDNESWTWGQATINDFCKSSAVEFMWGGDEDIPIGEPAENEIYVHI